MYVKVKESQSGQTILNFYKKDKNNEQQYILVTYWSADSPLVHKAKFLKR